MQKKGQKLLETAYATTGTKDRRILRVECDYLPYKTTSREPGGQSGILRMDVEIWVIL